MPGEIERKLLGQELVDGKMANKYKIVYSYQGYTSTVLQWMLPGSKIPSKMSAEDGSWVWEYKNIQFGSQPDSLFEVPAGYKIFSAGMSSMMDMGSGGPLQGEDSNY
jgi:hypothetical protein